MEFAWTMKPSADEEQYFLGMPQLTQMDEASFAE